MLFRNIDDSGNVNVRVRTGGSVLLGIVEFMRWDRILSEQWVILGLSPKVHSKIYIYYGPRAYGEATARRIEGLRTMQKS